jgi:hypothetical protein
MFQRVKRATCVLGSKLCFETVEAPREYRDVAAQLFLAL